MASLSNTKIKDTYESLVKFSDNGNITIGAKQLTDGFGNNSPFFVSTTQIGIGVTPTVGYDLHVNSDAKIGGNLIVSGNLTVSGTLTYLDVEDLATEDPLIKLARNNAGNSFDIGYFGQYVESAVTKYKGLFNDADDNKFKLFIGTSTLPTTVVNTGGTGYTVGTLVANLEGNVTGTVSSLSNHTTSNLAEGTNLYYTNARADARVNLQTGANLDLSSKDTDDLSEGSTNLYFTTTRARASFTEGTGVTITDGEIAIGQAVATDSNVTFGNITGSAISGTTGTFSGDLSANNLSGTNTGDQTLPTDFVSKANGGTFGGNVTSTGFSGPLTGNVTGNLTGNVTGDITGNAYLNTIAYQGGEGTELDNSAFNVDGIGTNFRWIESNSGTTGTTWKKVADVVITDTITPNGVQLEAKVYQPNTNSGVTAGLHTIYYSVAFRGRIDDSSTHNDAIVYGKDANLLRVYKTADYTFELQARSNDNNRDLVVECNITSKKGGKVTPTTTYVDGTITGGTAYTATANNSNKTKFAGDVEFEGAVFDDAEVEDLRINEFLYFGSGATSGYGPHIQHSDSGGTGKGMRITVDSDLQVWGVTGNAGEQNQGLYVAGGVAKLYDSNGVVLETVLGGVDITGTLEVSSTITGNVTGDITGDVTGDLTGDVTGDLTGSVTGAASLNVLKAGDTMTGDLILNDDVKANFGTDSDLEIYHDGTDGYIDNINGELIIQNNSDDKKIIFKSDNGIGDITEYFRIDGNINRNVITVTTQLNDNVPLIFGSGAGSPSIKYDSTAAQLFISGESKFLNNLNVIGNLDMPTAGSKIMVNAYNASNQEGGGIFFRDGFDVNNKYNLSIMARSKVDDGSPDGLSINANEGIAFSTGSNDYNERMYIDNSGNVGIGIDAVSKFHLKYSGGSYGADSTSGFINQAETGRATQRLRSITDSPAELFFDIDGGIAWDISARDSSSNYDLMFFGRGSTVGYNQVAGPYVRFHQTGNVTISGSMTVQGTSGSTFYGIDFQRSGSGVTTPDIWGNGNTLVLGHDSSTPVIKIDTTQTTFVGDVIFPTVQISNGQSYNENIRMFPSANNGYSSLVLGAVSGTSGTGSGQWTLVRYPSANSNKFTIRHNTLDIQTFTTAGNSFFAERLGVGNTSPTARLSVFEPVGSGASRTTPVTVMHLGTSHPSVGYEGFGTSIVDYRRTYQQSTSHAVNSIDFIERGNSANDFGGAIDFNTKALSSGTVAPVRRMRIDYTGKIGINTTSIPGFLTIKGASTANNPMLRINCDQASSFIHSTETIASSMTSGQTVINVIGRDGSTKNSAWMGYQFNGTTGADSNLLTFGHWGANHLLTIDGAGNTNIAGGLTINGNYSFSGLLLNTYTGTGSHVLKNGTSNGTVLTLTTSGDNRNLYLQTDHIYTDGTLHLGDNSYNTKYRAATHIFENGAATFASSGTFDGNLTCGNNSVQNGTTPGLKIQSTNTAQTVLGIHNTTTRNWEVAVGGSANGIGAGSFYIYDNTTNSARLEIDTSGNATFANEISSGDDINAGGKFVCANVGSDKKIAFRRTGANNYSIEHDASSLYFYNESTTVAPITIRNDGKVGINNNSPTEKPFEVNGGILVYTSRSGYDEDGIFFREGFTSGSLKYNCSILAKDHSGSFADGLSINGYDGISFCTGSNSRNQVGLFDVNGNFGVGIDPVSKMHLKYSGGSYGTEATSGFINEATTGRATMRLRSLTDAASELFFDVNGAIRWDISARNSGSSYALNFYPQSSNPNYAAVSANTFALYQDGSAYHSGRVGIGSSATGMLSVVGAGSGNNPTLAVDCTSSLTFNHAVEVFAGNMTATESVISLIGHSGSTNNSGYLGYIYSSSGSSDNQLTLGFWGNDHLVRLRPNGNFGIGVNPSYTLDVNGTARLKGHTTARLLMDTNGADASNYVGTINNYENAVYCGRGQTSFLVAGNQNIRFGFGSGVTLAQSKMVMYAGGQVNIGTSTNYTGTRLNVEGDRMGVRTSNSSWGQLYVANPNDGEAAIAFGAGGTGRPGGTSTYTRQWIMGVGPYSIGTSKWALSNKTLQGNPAITIIENTGAMGLRKVSPSYQLDVTGTIRASSDVIAFSDKRVKENIVTIDSALNKVTKLRGVTYTRKDTDDKSTKLGVIAQEVLEVLPEIVEKDDKGMYSVAYGNMAGVFIEAIKELKAEVDSLKQEIKELKK